MEHTLTGYTIGITATHATEQISRLSGVGATCLHGPMFDQPALLDGAAFVRTQQRWLNSGLSRAAFGLVGAVADHRVDALVFTSAPAIANFLAVADASVGRAALRQVSQTTTQLFALDPKLACALSASGIGEAESPDSATLESLLALVTMRLESSTTELEVAGATLSLRGRLVRIDDNEPAMLARRERRVLALLAARPGGVFSKASLLAEVWRGETADPTVVDKTILRLRQRLGAAGDAIETVTRSGYRLCPVALSAAA